MTVISNDDLSKAQLREWILTDESLLYSWVKVLHAIPECPEHGNECVPHALKWIEQVQSRRDELLAACKAALDRLTGLGYTWQGGPEFNIMHQLEEAIAGDKAGITVPPDPNTWVLRSAYDISLDVIALSREQIAELGGQRDELLKALKHVQENLEMMVSEKIIEYYDFSEIDNAITAVEGTDANSTTT